MINLNLDAFIDSNGCAHRIYKYFNSYGDECEKYDAVTAVAGSEGLWFSIKINEYTEAEISFN